MKDFQTDTVPRPLVKAAEAGLLPEWVQALPVPEKREFAKLASTAFADPARRFLPINTRECVLWSAAYAGAHPDWYPADAAGHVKAAAAAFGISEEVEKLLTFQYVSEKQASEAAPAMVKAAFALEINDGADFNLTPGKMELLPCHDEFHIEGSGESLSKAASQNTMPPELVHLAAVNLVKAAKASSCTDLLPQNVLRLGTERIADWSRADVLIGDRFKVAGADGLAAYREIIKMGHENPENADVLIEGLRDLDAEFGFTYWGSKASNVTSPWEVVYSGVRIDEIEKMAQTHTVIAGALVPMEVLEDYTDSAVDRLFGKEAAEIIKQAKAAGDNADATNLLAKLPHDVQVRLFAALAE